MRCVAVPLMLALLLAGFMARASSEDAGSGGRPAPADTFAPHPDMVALESEATPDTSHTDTAATDSMAAAPPADRVVVYYFHRTARCDNCLKFEAYADKALRQSFAGELADGVLEWRVVNLDDTTSVHFVEDYDLFEISLIVSNVRGGEETDWRNLDAIWHLVDDEDAFLKYATHEVGDGLRRLSEPRPHDEGPGLPLPGLAPESEDAEPGETHQR